jgi:hypothetical protein
MRLVVRIFEDITLVRTGILSSFVIDNNLSNATTVWWATFQMHNAMPEFLSLKSKNHPSLLLEYVKFLASDSGIKAVVQLTDRYNYVYTSWNEKKLQMMHVAVQWSLAGTLDSIQRKVDPELVEL